VGIKAALLFLVFSSLVFYGYWNPNNLILISFSIICNYFLGHFLQRNRKSKTLLFISIGMNLSCIFYYKYIGLFSDFLELVSDYSLSKDEIILPLAISFFTFQQIAYLVDSYQGKIKKGTFLEYALFVTFFPQLIAGPIVHYSEVINQFKSFKDRISWTNTFIALGVFSIGLFKKCVIADNLSGIVEIGFKGIELGQTTHFIQSWLSMLAYTLQIYFDFSGYSDMAIGIGVAFGIQLPFNFNSPYKSKNIIEFWRRWHMTLSRFLRDYLYIPLGGSRKGEFRRNVNLMATMILGGLWHGAGLSFIVWGGLHGAYLIVNHQWAKYGFVIPRALSALFTLFCVAIAWVFFRAPSLEVALDFLSSLFHFTPKDFTYTLDHSLIFIGLVGAVVFPNVIELFFTKNKNFQYLLESEKKEKAAYCILYSLMIGLALATSIYFLNKPGEFLYFNF